MTQSNLDIKDLSLLQTVSDNDRILMTKASENHSAAALTVANLKEKIIKSMQSNFAQSLTSTDSRNTVSTPQTTPAGLYADFKYNGNAGINDGGYFTGLLTFRKFGSGSDWTGGKAAQLAFTDNSNLWLRFGKDTAWESYQKVLTSTNYSSLLDSRYWHSDNREYIKAEITGSYKTLDLRTLDPDTWYPCTLPVSSRRRTKIIFKNALHGQKPVWGTHEGGFSMYLEWDVNGDGWGTTSENRVFYGYTYRFSQFSPCGGVTQNNMASVEIIWLRGGAVYNYWTDNNTSFAIHPNGYSWTYADYKYTAGIRKSNQITDPYVARTGSISAGTFIGGLFGNASTATSLASTRTIWGQPFNGTGNVSGALSGVTTITASGQISASRIFTGYDSGQTSSVSCSNWFRSSGATGWFNSTYGGGIYMTDSTWVRVYANKQFYISSTANSTSSTTGALRVDGGVGVGGNIVAGGEITAYSDIRLKQDIRNLTFRGKLNPKTYFKDGKTCIGFIAQEVQTLYPELVLESQTTEKYLSLNYDGITAVLQSQLNEQEDEIKALKRRVSELEELNNQHK